MDASKLEELLQEFGGKLLQEFGQKADSQSGGCGASASASHQPHGGTTVPAEDLASPAMASPASAGFAIAVNLARQALQNADSATIVAESQLSPEAHEHRDLARASEQLREARNLLAVSSPSGGGAAGPLPSRRQTARAYECVQQARHLVHEALPEAEKPAKDAALVVREILALLCCLEQLQSRETFAHETFAHKSFDALVCDAFGSKPAALPVVGSGSSGTPCPGTLSSQMHLARSSIARNARIGRGGRPAFDIAVAKTYKQLLSDDAATQLFEAYCQAAGTIGKEVGKISKDPALGPGGRAHGPEARAKGPSALDPQTSAWPSALGEGQGPWRGPSSPPPLSQGPLSLVSSRPLTTHTNSGSGGAGPVSLPLPWGPWGPSDERMALRPWRTSAQCGKCGTVATLASLQNESGIFQCPSCWQRQAEATGVSFSVRSGEEDSGNGIATLASVTPVYYHNRMEPQLSTAKSSCTIIDVDSGCCLQRARQSLGNACLLVLGGLGQGRKLVERASHLGLAVDPSTLAVPVGFISGFSPAFGCVYTPDVLILTDMYEPWRVCMIYVQTTEPDMQIPDREMFLQEIHEKLVNVLRIAHRHGHDDLILTDVWGCRGAERPRGIKSTHVAETIRNVFTAGALDVASAFHRITLMIPGSEASGFKAMFGPVAAYSSSAAAYYYYYSY